MSSWAANRPRGQLRDVDQLDVAGSSPSSSRGASRSATTTSASISALRPATETSSGSPGPAADQHHAGRAVAVVRRGDGALAQALEDLVAHGRGADAGSRLPSTATVMPDVTSHGGRPGRRRGRVVGAHAEDPALLGGRADRLVDGVVVGGRDDVPGIVEVGVLEPAPLPA